MTHLDATGLIDQATDLMRRQDYNESEILFQSCLKAVLAHESASIKMRLRELRELVLSELGYDLSTRNSVAHSTDNIAEAVKLAMDGHTESTVQVLAQSVNHEEDDFDCKLFHPNSQLMHGRSAVFGGQRRRYDSDEDDTGDDDIDDFDDCCEPWEDDYEDYNDAFDNDDNDCDSPVELEDYDETYDPSDDLEDYVEPDNGGPDFEEASSIADEEIPDCDDIGDYDDGDAGLDVDDHDEPDVDVDIDDAISSPDVEIPDYDDPCDDDVLQDDRESYVCDDYGDMSDLE
ncbi:hypothetical protein HDE_10926 [Halotydeus destructor]|nr:hypothetical protein HDE_10926 [Halotydeus destructor]